MTLKELPIGKTLLLGLQHLFAMFGGKHDALKMQCLEDADCTPDKAKDLLLAEIGRNATPSNKNSFSHQYYTLGYFNLFNVMAL